MRKPLIAALGALIGLCGPAMASAQTPGSGRVAVPAADADWVEVNRQEIDTGYVDRRSIRVENGIVRYLGRLVFAEPQEDGTVEIYSIGEIDCARRDFRPVAYDVLGAGGRVLGSFTPTVAELPASAVNPDSPNETLIEEHCPAAGN